MVVGLEEVVLSSVRANKLAWTFAPNTGLQKVIFFIFLLRLSMYDKYIYMYFGGFDESHKNIISYFNILYDICRVFYVK